MRYQGATPLRLRQRWKQIRDEPALLRVGLLATYTADPLVPYLGAHLHAARLPARLSVGPYHQIAQQCVDDDSQTARFRPDVLAILARPEDVADRPDWLIEVADLAAAATTRWRCCLLFTLPALPESAPLGVGDLASPGGAVASAVATREALRARFAGRPNIHLADAEAAVRMVGARHAYHPALMQTAKIPYTEEVFAELGRQLATVLRTRYGDVCQGVVLDADSLLSVQDAAHEGTGTLGNLLSELRQAGVRIGLRGTGAPHRAWPAIRDGLGDGWPALLDDLIIDDRPLAVQVADLAGRMAVPADQVTVLKTRLDEPDDAGVLALGDDPDRWWANAVAAGLLDRLPVDRLTAPGPVTAPSSGATPTLEDYVSSLGVEITWKPADLGALPSIADTLVRTKDFTLGIPHREADLAARLPEGTIEVGVVKDRLGDYGAAAAIGLDCREGVATVDLFVVTCPALGKGVEAAAVRRIVTLARERGCSRVTFRYRETNRNTILTEFLREVTAGSAILTCEVP